MNIEISQIREGLATNLKTLAMTRQVSAYRLGAPTPPSLIVVGFDEVVQTTFGKPGSGGSYQFPFLIQGLAGAPTTKSAQIVLDKWLSPMGSLNVWAAIESDTTLGGVIDSLQVTKCDGPQYIEAKPGVEMLGSTWHVTVTI